MTDEKVRDEFGTTFFPERTCPVCQMKLDAASHMTDRHAVPSEGDITICIGCASFLVFGPEFSLREMSVLEVGMLPDELRIELQRMRRAVEKVNRAKKKTTGPTRAEHLAWCKTRALEYVDRGQLRLAFSSMLSDLSKHPETAQHPAIGLGTGMIVLGYLNTRESLRAYIEGFR